MAADAATVIASLGDPIVTRIAAELERAGSDGLTKRAILRNVFQRNLPASKLDAALELLRVNGLVRSETVVPTRGRPRTIWRRAG